MKTLFAFAIFPAVLCAQAAIPASSGGPVVGFLQGPGSLELTPILGISSAASLDAPVPAPSGTAKLYLPPREQYALLEKSNASPVAVWDLDAPREGRTRSIPAALAHPDLVAFSPKGTSAGLYSSVAGKLEILAGLPGMPSVKIDLPAQTLGSVASLVLSDDGLVVLARNFSGQFYLWSRETAWRLMPWSFSSHVWSFAANSHDLVLSDSQQGLLLFHQVDGPNSPPSILLRGAEPDSLAFTSDGQNIIAADSSNGALWSIDLASGSTRAVAGPAHQPAPVTLRDGHTFFLSFAGNASFSLLKLSAPSAEPVILVHPGLSTALAQGAAQ